MISVLSCRQNFSVDGITRLHSEPQRLISQQLEGVGKECKLPIYVFTPSSSFLETCLQLSPGCFLLNVPIAILISNFIFPRVKFASPFPSLVGLWQRVLLISQDLLYPSNTVIESLTINWTNGHPK